MKEQAWSREQDYYPARKTGEDTPGQIDSLAKEESPEFGMTELIKPGRKSSQQASPAAARLELSESKIRSGARRRRKIDEGDGPRMKARLRQTLINKSEIRPPPAD